MVAIAVALFTGGAGGPPAAALALCNGGVASAAAGTGAAGIAAGTAAGPPGWIVLGANCHDTLAGVCDPPSVDAVERGIDAAIGRFATNKQLATRAMILPHTVRDENLTYGCWQQLLVSGVPADMACKKMSIEALIEQGVIVSATATSVVGQNGRTFHLCPVLRQKGAASEALEWIGLHAVPV